MKEMVIRLKGMKKGMKRKGEKIEKNEKRNEERNMDIEMRAHEWRPDRENLCWVNREHNSGHTRLYFFFISW